MEESRRPFSGRLYMGDGAAQPFWACLVEKGLMSTWEAVHGTAFCSVEKLPALNFTFVNREEDTWQFTWRTCRYLGRWRWWTKLRRFARSGFNHRQISIGHSTQHFRETLVTVMSTVVATTTVFLIHHQFVNVWRGSFLRRWRIGIWKIFQKVAWGESRWAAGMMDLPSICGWNCWILHTVG